MLLALVTNVCQLHVHRVCVRRRTRTHTCLALCLLQKAVVPLPTACESSPFPAELQMSYLQQNQRLSLGPHGWGGGSCFKSVLVFKDALTSLLPWAASFHCSLSPSSSSEQRQCRKAAEWLVTSWAASADEKQNVPLVWIQYWSKALRDITQSLLISVKERHI